MGSVSRSTYLKARKKALRLLEISTDTRLRPLTYADMEPALHAGLAAFVSSWEAYIEGITLEIIDEISRVADARLLALCTVLRAEAKRATEKFNTPNFEGSRDIVFRYTGFDPINYMASPRLGLSVQQTQTRLNEILRVRHAFAHGFPMPNLPWLTRYGVASRMSKFAATSSGTLISDLVDAIDSHAGQYLRTSFASTVTW